MIPLLARASFLLFLLVCTAFGETIFTATVDSGVTGSGSPALGAAMLTLNDEETEVSYFVEIANLLGFEIGTHFHSLEPVPVGSRYHSLPFGAVKTGTWEVGPTEVAELKDGKIYVLVHTDSFPVGEVRGDFTSSTVATASYTWGSVKTLFR